MLTAVTAAWVESAHALMREPDGKTRAQPRGVNGKGGDIVRVGDLGRLMG